MPKAIYLDNSMTTRPSERAVSAMLPFYSERWGVPSAPHEKGQELYGVIEDSYRNLYRFLDAKDEDQFVLTSSGVEAVNQVFLHAYQEIMLPTGRNQFITSQVDEAAALMSIHRLEKFGGVGKFVGVNPCGLITADALCDAMTPRTALVSISWANGLTGVIQPVSELSLICEERGVPLHLEGSHILGRIYFEQMDHGATFLSFNGDHLHAPKGTGGLWIKNGTKCASFIVGGLEQGGLRAGSLNVPGLVSLACAAEEMIDCRDLLCTEIARLRDRLEQGILAGFPDAKVFFHDQERLPHCSAIGFPGNVNELFLYHLNQQGVYASIGGGETQQIGLVLAASGIPYELAQTAINFSLSRETNEAEIEDAIRIIVETAKRLAPVSGTLIKNGKE